MRGARQWAAPYMISLYDLGWTSNGTAFRQRSSENACPDKIARFAYSVLDRAARCAARRSGNRCAPRHLQAQCAVPARWPPRLLLRLHGCDGAEPLSADLRLCEGGARQGGVLRPPARGLPEGEQAILGRGSQHLRLGFGRRYAESDRLCPQARAAAASHRRRDGIPAARCRLGAAPRLCRQRDRRCGRRARAAACAQKCRRACEAARRLRPRHQFDACGDREARAWHDQARAGGCPASAKKPGAGSPSSTA